MFWELFTGKPSYKPFWALSDISFEVRRGQVVGVLGRNGAGKSTLLKIITGTLDKTDGNVEVNGRISSILEMGTGFNMEYTGRDNIYLGGLMVGLTREEIKQKEDWIIEFSELRDFIDQPFKTYSSGMQARLTFSTAVCIDPDLLIIDEALAAGDARFSRKSFGKIEEFRRAGNTILLVSHDINTISTFCDHALILEHGRIFDQGKPYRMGQVYYDLLFGSGQKTSGTEAPQCEDAAPLQTEEPDIERPQGEQPGDQQAPSDHNDTIQVETVTAVQYDPSTAPESQADSGQTVMTGEHKRLLLRQNALKKLNLAAPLVDHGNIHQMRLGNKKAEILDFGILDEEGKRVKLLKSGRKYIFFQRAVFYEDVSGVVTGFVIRNIKGVDMYGTTTRTQKISVPSQRQGNIIETRLYGTMWLTNGIYFLTVAMADPDAETDVQYDQHFDGLQFEIETTDGIFGPSVVNLNAHMEFKQLGFVVGS